MPLSLKNYTGDGVTTDYLFDIPYIAEVDLHGYVDGSEVPITFVDPTHVRFTTVPVDQSTIQLKRLSGTSIRHQFPDRNYIDSTRLDGNSTHQLYLVEEQQDITDLQLDATNAATSAEAVANALRESRYLPRAIETDLDDNGNASTAGDSYYNSALGLDRTYNGAGWQNTGSGATSASTVAITDTGNHYPIHNTEAALQTAGANIATNTAKLAGLNTKIIDIGDWDMDTDASVSVAHGIANFTKIRKIDVLIRDDADNAFGHLDFWSDVYQAAGTGNNGASADATHILIERSTSGFFDRAVYNLTSYNRGWITIQYID